MNASHRCDVNWGPRSVVTVDGTPNWDIHVSTNPLATVLAVLSRNGMASGHCVKQSTHVSR